MLNRIHQLVRSLMIDSFCNMNCLIKFYFTDLRYKFIDKLGDQENQMYITIK